MLIDLKLRLNFKYLFTQRWYIDGTVECFTGGHGALAIFAILILGLCTVLIVAVAAITMEKLNIEACVYNILMIVTSYVYVQSIYHTYHYVLCLLITHM